MLRQSTLPLEGRVTNIEIEYWHEGEAVTRSEFSYIIACQDNECIGTGSCSQFNFEADTAKELQLEPLVFPDDTISEISSSLANVERISHNDRRLQPVHVLDSRQWKQVIIMTDRDEKITLQQIDFDLCHNTLWAISTEGKIYLQETDEFAAVYCQMMDEPWRTCVGEVWN